MLPFTLPTLKGLKHKSNNNPASVIFFINAMPHVEMVDK